MIYLWKYFLAESFQYLSFLLAGRSFCQPSCPAAWGGWFGKLGLVQAFHLKRECFYWRYEKSLKMLMMMMTKTSHRMDFTEKKLLGEFRSSVNFYFLCYLNAVQLRSIYRIIHLDVCWINSSYLLNGLNNRILATWVKHPLLYRHRVARHGVDEHWRERIKFISM